MNSGKRVFDVTLTATLGLLLAPIAVGIALLVRWRMGSPVLFRQVRTGFVGRPFTILKFRTMNDGRDENGQLLPDKERLGPLGHFLRATSLDELPELINVLKGEMSLVGPRPLVPHYDPFFTDEERLRFTVLPGITGLAQVSGRNQLSWDERLAADVEYVRTHSVWLDVRILLRTLKGVLLREGVKPDPRSAMVDLDVERVSRCQLASSKEANG
ncbi:MAG: sugar transferase [Armatimonadetes bacterium]|nr:sugar transferase [Armatimonadota bacterium]